MAHIKLQTPGQPVSDFGVSGTTITIAGTNIDCAALQADSQVLVNVAKDRSGAILVNPANGGTCLAILRIPPKQYQEIPGEPAEQDGEPIIVRQELPLDPNAIEVELWPIV